jgi:predicted DNA-binding transcriptional regulator YafY
VRSSRTVARRSRARYEATLRIEPRAAESLRRWRTATPVAAEPDATGWPTLRVAFDDEEQASFVALGYGPRAEVLAPESLRRRVAADLAAASARRRAGTDPSHRPPRPLG